MCHQRAGYSLSLISDRSLAAKTPRRQEDHDNNWRQQESMVDLIPVRTAKLSLALLIYFGFLGVMASWRLGG
jgi:hypothetical protein